MNNQEKFRDAVEKVSSGDYERMKCNFDEIIDLFFDNIPGDDFAEILSSFDLIMKVLMGDQQIVDAIAKKAKTNDSKEVIHMKLQRGAVIDFVRMVKDYEKHFRFILDKIEYPSMEIV